MRNHKTLIIFALITFGVLLAAIVFQPASVTPPSNITGLLLPKLGQKLDSIYKIKIVHAGDVVTLQRQVTDEPQGQSQTQDQSQIWTVVEKSLYPAKNTKIRELLFGLVHIKRLEPKTKNPKNYSILGLTEPDKKTSKAGQIQLLDKADRLITQVTLGRREPDPNTTTPRNDLYALVKGDPQSWLVLGRLPTLGAPGAWLQPNLLEIDTKRITKVTIIHKDNETIQVISKPDALDQFTLNDLKAEESLQSDYILKDIVDRFSKLQLEDVQLARDLKWPAALDLQVKTQTKDGLVITIAAAKVGEHTWLRLTATTVPVPATDLTKDSKAIDSKPTDTSKPQTSKQAPVANKAESTAQARIQSKATKPPKKSPQQEAKELNARWKGWAYKLADWAYQTLNKRRSDLIKSGTEEASEASDASDAPINNDVGATDEAAIDIETELDAGAPPTDIEMLFL